MSRLVSGVRDTQLGKGALKVFEAEVLKAKVLEAELLNKGRDDHDGG